MTYSMAWLARSLYVNFLLLYKPRVINFQSFSHFVWFTVVVLGIAYIFPSSGTGIVPLRAFMAFMAGSFLLSLVTSCGHQICSILAWAKCTSAMLWPALELIWSFDYSLQSSSLYSFWQGELCDKVVADESIWTLGKTFVSSLLLYLLLVVLHFERCPLVFCSKY